MAGGKGRMEGAEGEGMLDGQAWGESEDGGWRGRAEGKRGWGGPGEGMTHL